MEENKKKSNKGFWYIIIGIVVVLLIALGIWWGGRKDSSETSPESTEATKSATSAETSEETEAGATEEAVVSTENTEASTEEKESFTTEETPSEDETAEEPTESVPETEKDPSISEGEWDNGLDTGNLSENASEYVGTVGTGLFNYGEALQKSLLFYELQRSGDLPVEVRCNWRGDSCLHDGSLVGLDLTGGWYDAGDHVKFNLPMAYTSTMLAWSLYEDWDVYEETNQLSYALANVRWANDYFIKCHPEKYVYYYQVGDGNRDHSWWGPAEAVEAEMERPCYKVDLNNPGSCVVAETAASLAAAALIFEESDPAYAALCLQHAKELYAFADETRSDAGYTAANGFYNSWSGYWDELGWAAAWLYLATDDTTYLEASKAAVAKAEGDYEWAHCWDNVYFGTNLLLARITKDNQYSSEVEHHLDTWTVGYDGLKVPYTPDGLACIDQWGSLRYATTTAFLATLYSTWDGCPADKSDRYWDFAVNQVNYALGSTGRSFVVGFGENPPEHPHHRTAQGSPTDNMNNPNDHRHTLYGALVGGPNSSGYYEDTVSNYSCNEVACDYNAGFTGVLAKLYSVYKGQTLKNFGAVEDLESDELYVQAGVNVSGNDFLEIRAFVFNETGWPARVCDNLEMRYFIDLTEVYEAGGTASNLEVTGNYMQGGKIGGLYVWDEEKHIYYVSIDFTGAKIYPGGQEEHKKEVQFRIRNANGAWDNTNDPSFVELVGNNGSNQVKAYHFALYEDGVLVFGSEPAKGDQAGTIVTQDPNTNQNNSNQNNNNNNNNNNQNNGGNQSGNVGDAAENKNLRVQTQSQNQSGSGNTIAASLELTNISDGYLVLSDLEVDYYFTGDGASTGQLAFWCDYAAVNSAGGYGAVQDFSGVFEAVSGTDCDMVCRISSGTAQKIAANGTVMIQLRITKTDWSNFNLSNDYSSQGAEHIVVRYQGEIIFGTEP